MSNRASRHEPRRRARRRALQALYQWRLNPSPLAGIVRQFRQAQDFSNVDEDWFEALVLGVGESLESLGRELQPFTDRPFSSLDVMEQVILAMGAWELRHDLALPAPVIIDEAVELTRKFGAEQGHAFVNAVLDQAAREWRSQEAQVNGSPGEGDGV